jgi:tripartite-type tricarboxylate transporter receptor subunit TctC
MQRRKFITLPSGVATWPLAVRAQQPERKRQIGVLLSEGRDREVVADHQGSQPQDAIAGRANRGSDMMIRGVIVAVMVLAGATGTQAQSFPSKPITIVVPLAAGGAVDRMVRVLIEPMKTSLGQPILVENIGGAGGTIGITRVARAAPDGYTVSIGTWGTHVLNSFVYSPPYDLQKDFEPMALLPNVPQWLIGRKDLPAKDLQELIAWLKANPAGPRRDRSAPAAARP